jgi:cysteinyl-tRNA synthetase
MVELIADLVARGAAYDTDDGVYMDVSTVEGYGLLAHQPLDSLRAGARVEVSDQKRSPLDFALWKRAKPGEPSWASPWGPGRPGWHTECVVMSLALLGEDFDLHGGGQDLAFPHHENERAQAVAEGRRFARHWAHNGWVVVDGEKMSKSLANFTTLAELLATGDARAYRLLVLRSHYRRPIEVTAETAADAEKALGRLDRLAQRLSLADPMADAPGGVVVRPEAAPGETAGVDLDTPGALAGIFDLVTLAHAAADSGEDGRAQVLGRTVAVLCGALGLRLRSRGAEIDEATRHLVAERDEARRARDWARADALRDELTAGGWTVEDGPGGTVVRR